MRACLILAVFAALEKVNTWLKCKRPQPVSKKPSQEAKRPWVMIDVTSSAVPVLPGNDGAAVMTSLDASGPITVHRVSSDNQVFI